MFKEPLLLRKNLVFFELHEIGRQFAITFTRVTIDLLLCSQSFPQAFEDVWRAWVGLRLFGLLFDLYLTDYRSICLCGLFLRSS